MNLRATRPEHGVFFCRTGGGLKVGAASQLPIRSNPPPRVSKAALAVFVLALEARALGRLDVRQVQPGAAVAAIHHRGEAAAVGGRGPTPSHTRHM